jgi:ankyrin repeat protein
MQCRDRHGGTPLDDAVRSRSKPIVDFLVRSYNTHVQSTAVYVEQALTAAATDDYELLGILVTAGVSPNCSGRSHRTPLHMAVAAHSHKAFAYLLALPDIELGPVDRRGNTPLWDAVLDGNYDMAKQLRDAGAPIQDGVAEYMCQAVADKNSDFIELMLKVGVSLNVKACICNGHALVMSACQNK